MALPFKKDYVVINRYSRPAIKLLAHKGIVIHYTANKGATAHGHQAFFDGADGGGGRYAGAHIFVDKKEALCIIPLNEVAYHANERPSKIKDFKATASYYQGGDANLVTIGVEMCIEADGSFHPDTVKRTQAVVKYLMEQYKIPVSKVVRHYDITGKLCPKPYVESPKAWTAFKAGLTATASKPVASSDHKDVTAHKVAKGETLYSIAKLHKMTVKELKSLNKLKSDTIHEGQLLVFKKATAAKPKTKLLTVKANELYTYKTANWNNKGVTVKKNEIFTVVDTVTVDGAKMYKLKSGLYITASTKYVSVK